MSLILTLFIGCVAIMSSDRALALLFQPAPPPPVAVKPPQPDTTKECAEEFKLYHECSGERRYKEDKFREERRQNLTATVFEYCFEENGCKPPQLPPQQVETPEEQACRDAFRAVKRVEIQKCVNKAYPSYVFGNDIDRSHVGDDHLHRVLGLNAEHCANKQVVLACALEAVENFRKTRYQLNCGIKENCRVLMSEKCQDHHRKIKYAKCECKKQVKQIAPTIRASIPACRLVPPKPQRPAHDCPINGFCKAGYVEWLKNHPPPTLTQVASANAAAVRAFSAPVVAATQAAAAVPAAQAFPTASKSPPVAVAQPMIAAAAKPAAPVVAAVQAAAVPAVPAASGAARATAFAVVSKPSPLTGALPVVAAAQAAAAVPAAPGAKPFAGVPNLTVAQPAIAAPPNPVQPALF